MKTGRPEAPAKVRYTLCERCEDESSEIRCAYGNYWLCPDCVALHAWIAGMGIKAFLRNKWL